MKDPVDVLIIGAGASGAAVAWSLAETKMHILCLEQGGWMNPAEYPSTGRDWEAKFYGEWSSSPNVRGRPEDYPINDDNSPIKVVNFNGVGGSTVTREQMWTFEKQTLDQAVNLVPGVTARYRPPASVTRPTFSCADLAAGRYR